MINQLIKDRINERLNQRREDLIINRQLEPDGLIKVNSEDESSVLSLILKEIGEFRSEYDKDDLWGEVINMSDVFFKNEKNRRYKQCSFIPKMHATCINMRLYGLGVVGLYNKTGYISSITNEGFKVRLDNSEQNISGVSESEKEVFIPKSEYWSIQDLIIDEGILSYRRNNLL